MVGRIRFALERLGSPRHSFHVAQLWSLGDSHEFFKYQIGLLAYQPAPAVRCEHCRGLDYAGFIYVH